MNYPHFYFTFCSKATSTKPVSLCRNRTLKTFQDRLFSASLSHIMREYVSASDVFSYFKAEKVF